MFVHVWVVPLQFPLNWYSSVSNKRGMLTDIYLWHFFQHTPPRSYSTTHPRLLTFRKLTVK